MKLLDRIRIGRLVNPADLAMALPVSGDVLSHMFLPGLPSGSYPQRLQRVVTGLLS